jgi:PBSX family phage terminase large subunit
LISDAEILELETLLLEEERYQLQQDLIYPEERGKSKNYCFLHNAIISQKYNEKGELVSGYRGASLEGSSRSTKTWSGVDIIIWLCTEVETNCSIKIYRETYNEIKETLYDDFKRRLDDFGLPNPFHTAQEVKSFKIGNNKISFLGCDKIGKAHGSGCDYAFFNEIIHIPKAIFDQVEMRCRKFWWCDFNPSLTEHWVFDSIITRDDVGYLHSTFRDNPYLSIQERNKILSYEPWETGSYEIVNNTDIYYKGNPVTDKNQPPPHKKNVNQGTADVYMWTVYGLGLRGAMEGVIFNHVTWISREDIPAHLAPIGTIDFGFTNDPCAINRYWEDALNIYIEPLIYTPIDNPNDISEALKALGFTRNMPIICDSSDKYTHETKGAVEMVIGLKKLGWSASKVNKTKSVVFWLTSMKTKKIHIITNHLYKEAKKERENYKWKEINGILINQPDDKFNHMWDSARYGHIVFNQNKVQNNTQSWAGGFG